LLNDITFLAMAVMLFSSPSGPPLFPKLVKFENGFSFFILKNYGTIDILTFCQNSVHQNEEINMPRNVIIDCDTGMDDAQALLLALRSPAFNVLGITCVNGNVTLDKVLINTLKVVEHSGKDIPVFRGAADALIPEKSQNAPEIHGSDGLGNLDFPQPVSKPAEENAVAFTIRTLLAAVDPMEWILLGPLTNAALAIREEPRILEKVSMLTMMAGANEFGNTTAAAEFNVFADPEAAKIVFEADIPKTMVPLDPLWHGGQINKEYVDQLAARNDLPWCDMAARIMHRTIEMASGSRRLYAMGAGAVSPPDLLTVAVCIDPSIGHFENFQVRVETQGQYTRGMTVFDRRWNRVYDENTHVNQMAVCLSADPEKYGRLLVETLAK
jgi:inosine-uridine nucleoside N-ribohydrolase